MDGSFPVRRDGVSLSRCVGLEPSERVRCELAEHDGMEMRTGGASALLSSGTRKVSSPVECS